MGWDFYADKSRDKAYVVAELKEGRDLGDDYKVVACSVVGNHVWRALECAKENPRHKPGHRLLELTLLQGGGKMGMGWGVKYIGESAGPCYYDCPLYLLDMVPCPEGEWAPKWRESVIEHHAEKAAAAKLRAELKPGMVVSVHGLNYKLVMKRAKDWLGVRDGVEGGPYYRINKNIKPAVAA